MCPCTSFGSLPYTNKEQRDIDAEFDCPFNYGYEAINYLRIRRVWFPISRRIVDQFFPNRLVMTQY